MQYNGTVIGVVGFSGLASLDLPKQTALQLISYNIFARSRAFTIFVSTRDGVALTGRERQVIQLSAEGLTSAEIARRLGLSARTVNQYIDNVARKLGTKNRTHAVAEAIRKGLLT